MKKIRKRQKKILLMGIIIIAIAMVFIAIIINKAAPKGPDVSEEESTVKTLPEITYSDMEVKNIVMQLLKGNSQDGRDETIITFDIHNTTDQKVEEQRFETVLMDKNDKILARMEIVYIQELDVGQVQNAQVIYKGDFTATARIKLVKI